MTLGTCALGVVRRMRMHAKAGCRSRGRRVTFIPLPLSFDVTLLLQLMDMFAICEVTQSNVPDRRQAEFILTFGLRPKRTSPRRATVI